MKRLKKVTHKMPWSGTTTLRKPAAHNTDSLKYLIIFTGSATI